MSNPAAIALPAAEAAALPWRCVAPSEDLLGETPLWCEATQSLLWLDVDQARLHRLHLPSGRRDRFQFEARFVGSLALCEPGTVLLALDLALHRFELATGRLTLLAQVEPVDIDNRLNDGRCDSRGRFWVGTMDNQLSRPNGHFYRVDPDGRVERFFGGIRVSNTVAFSPDERTMYFSDTRAFTTWAFEVDMARGRLGERRVFVDHTATRERPDGACVDSEGHVWCAIFGGARVVRYTPDGRIDRVLPVPASNPTCLCLGGPGRRTLFVTTARKFLDDEALRIQPWAGSVLALDVEVPGLPEHRFGL